MLEEIKNVRVEDRRDVMLYGTCKFSSRPFCTHFKGFLIILNSCRFPQTKPLLIIIYKRHLVAYLDSDAKKSTFIILKDSGIYTQKKTNIDW